MFDANAYYVALDHVKGCQREVRDLDAQLAGVVFPGDREELEAQLERALEALNVAEGELAALQSPDE